MWCSYFARREREREDTRAMQFMLARQIRPRIKRPPLSALLWRQVPLSSSPHRALHVRRMHLPDRNAAESPGCVCFRQKWHTPMSPHQHTQIYNVLRMRQKRSVSLYVVTWKLWAECALRNENMRANYWVWNLLGIFCYLKSAFCDLDLQLNFCITESFYWSKKNKSEDQDHKLILVKCLEFFSILVGASKITSVILLKNVSWIKLKNKTGLFLILLGSIISLCFDSTSRVPEKSLLNYPKNENLKMACF